MCKELFMAAHEELIEEYRMEHPDATWTEAYEKTADPSYERMKENLADRIDQARVQAKYQEIKELPND